MTAAKALGERAADRRLVIARGECGRTCSQPGDHGVDLRRRPAGGRRGTPTLDVIDDPDLLAAVRGWRPAARRARGPAQLPAGARARGAGLMVAADLPEAAGRRLVARRPARPDRAERDRPGDGALPAAARDRAEADDRPRARLPGEEL